MGKVNGRERERAKLLNEKWDVYWFRHFDMMTDPINISSIFSRAESSTLHSRLSTMLCIFSSSLFFHCSLPLLPAGFRERNNFETKIDLEYFNSLKLSRAGSVRFFNIILRSCRIQERLWVESLFFFVGKMFVKGRKNFLHLLIPIQHRSTSCRKSLNNEKPVNQYQTAVAVVKLKVGRRILSTLREEFSHLLCGTLT